MKVFAIAFPTEGTTFEQMMPVLGEEARRAWDLQRADVFREVYLRTDDLGAVVVLEADSVDGARDTLATLPMVQAGLVNFDVVVSAGAFQPYEFLFAPTHQVAPNPKENDSDG
jgi:muconolactone delta-isomerase